MLEQERPRAPRPSQPDGRGAPPPAGVRASDGPAAHGFVAPGFEAVAAAFEVNLATRGEVGAAFAAVVDGRTVVDLWGGVADEERGRPWKADTVAGIFSGSKGLVAVCLLVLLERGALDLDAPVSAYWPEFAANGKDTILVRHVVSHQAGLPGLTEPVTMQEATDDRRMARLLAAQAPVCPPGTQVAYHAVTYGWLCGELIRRIDGRSAGRFFAEEVAAPLGLDAWIGLPAEQEHRVAVLQRGPGLGTLAASARDGVAWSIWANPPRFAVDPMPANTRAWRAAEVPAANAVASARSLARLDGCLARGGELDGVRLLFPETIALGARCLARGVDPYLRAPLAFGVGFQLQTEERPYGPADEAFGHTGSGGSVHGAWPRLRTGFAYVPSSLHEPDGPDARRAALLEALHDAIA